MIKIKNLIISFCVGIGFGCFIWTFLVIGAELFSTEDDEGTSKDALDDINSMLNPNDNVLFLRPHVERDDPLLVTFTFLTLTAPLKPFSAFYVDTGEGITKANITNPVITHRYTNVSEYFALYWAEYENGSITNTKECHFDLSNVNHSAPFIYFLPEEAILRFNAQPVKFSFLTSYDLDGTIVDYRIDFGDGSHIQRTNISVTNNGLMITHKYEKVGRYEARAMILDDQGLMAEKMVFVMIRPNY